MRLVGIGLLAYLLISLALLFSKFSIYDQGKEFISEFIDGPSLVFETIAIEEAGEFFQTKIEREKSFEPIILSGLPDYHRTAFHLPKDVRPKSGYLQIDITFQVSPHVNGSLRVSIDNTKRGEILLPTGLVKKSLRIPLAPKELIREMLVVSISMFGTGKNTTCNIDDGVEAIAEIETTSAIFIETESELESVSDRLKKWGKIAHVSWPKTLSPQNSLMRLVAMTKFRQTGQNLLLASTHSKAAFKTDELNEASQIYNDNEKVFPGNSNSVDLVTQTSNKGVRRFHRKNIWRHSYNVLNDGNGELLNSLDLELLLSRQLSDEFWIISVTLNKHIVLQDHFTSKGGTYNKLVELPRKYQETFNSIEISVSSSNNPEDICEYGPELMAELLPSTKLNLGKLKYSDPLIVLKSYLKTATKLTIGLDETLEPTEAYEASELLASILPKTTKLVPVMDGAQIIVGKSRKPDENSNFVFRDQTSMQISAELANSTSAKRIDGLHLKVQLDQQKAELQNE